MSVRPLLEHRAVVRAAVRACFEDRGFIEVDTPVLSREILPEPYIEPVALTDSQGTRYLQTSPEALMKRLLARSSGPIYQFAHCFRAEERGPRHDTEFIMLEWYQPGASLDETVELVSNLLQNTLGTTGLERISCRDAFDQHAGVDPHAATTDELLAAVTALGLTVPEGSAALPASERRSLAFDLLLSEIVSPRLGFDSPVMLEAWPATEAAFARLDPLDPTQARRFEVFAAGVELANGWEEEPSATILKERLLVTNQLRRSQGRQILPLPDRLLAAHGETMPAGVGAALAFDRLVMLASGATTIDEVRGFSSNTA